MRRYGLHDDEWDRIKDLLPGRLGHVGVTAADNRLFVEAVLYRYRTGMPWRDLPKRFGDWKAVHTRFSRWAKAGAASPPQDSRQAGLGARYPGRHPLSCLCPGPRKGPRYLLPEQRQADRHGFRHVHPGL